MTARRLAVSLAVAGVALVACGSDDDSASSTVAATTTITTTPASDTVPPTEPLVTAGTEPPGTSDPGGPSEVTYYDEGDIEVGLAPFVARATADLAARLGIPADQISTHSAVLVVWPNGALGCPQQGMSYAQVLTDGAVIELAVGEDVYRYHSGGDADPFPCSRPLDPLPQRL